MTRNRAPGSPRQRSLTLRSLSRAVSWHRRKLAVVAAMAAVLTGINATLPAPAPTTEVVRTVARLDGGVVLRAEDVTVTRLPARSVPEGALTTLSAALGATVAAPTAKGQVLTELSVAPASRSARVGRVVAPLRLADADLVSLLTVGTVVDVIAADSGLRRAAIVGRAVRIVGLPPPPTSSSGVGATASSSGAALVLVEVDSKTATLLAQAAVTSTLSVVLR